VAQCKLCERSRWFLNLTTFGLCKSCAKLLGEEVQSRYRLISKSIRAIEHSMRPDAKVARCGVIIEHAEALLKYEGRGLPFDLDQPSELLATYRRLRAEIIETIAVEPVMTEVGIVDPICPYCGVVLPEMPKSKKKCRKCRSPIFVKKRPIDQRYVLVTEEQLDLIEEQWAIANGTHERFLEGRRFRDEVRRQLTMRLGRVPLPHEMERAVLEEEAAGCVQTHDWGAYRNARMNIGFLMRDNGDPQGAISELLQVCYLDLNGPRNLGGLMNDPALLRKYKPFVTTEGELVPGIVAPLAEIVADTEIASENLMQMFFEVGNKLHDQLSLPIKPETAWSLLIGKLGEYEVENEDETEGE